MLIQFYLEKLRWTKLYRSHCIFAMIIKLKSYHMHIICSDLSSILITSHIISAEKHKWTTKISVLSKLCEYKMNQLHFTGCAMTINRSNQMWCVAWKLAKVIKLQRGDENWQKWVTSVHVLTNITNAMTWRDTTYDSRHIWFDNNLFRMQFSIIQIGFYTRYVMICICIYWIKCAKYSIQIFDQVNHCGMCVCAHYV